MNREIKFRAWDLTEKRWDNIRSEYSQDVGAKNYFGIDKEFIRFNRGDIDLMQFTGLKDKNGKEIYEGDILYHKGRSPKEYKLIVVWKNYKWGFQQVEDKTKGHPINQLWKYPKNFEIVGNIYETITNY
uniref:Putative YopX protein n=1 Tax=viral metagenome TaxID=1070528 RepID=A0A6H1ZNU7_9ZZZZ